MTICLRRFGPVLMLVPMLMAASASANEKATDPAPASDAQSDEILITGSRQANASINGLAIDPHLLPQNVRLLDDQLIERAGFTDLSQLFDLAGGMSRQNSFGGAWDAYAIRGFSGDINQGPDLLVNRFSANRGFNARRDVATVESFQVLKGPASALSGKGETGRIDQHRDQGPARRFSCGRRVRLCQLRHVARHVRRGRSGGGRAVSTGDRRLSGRGQLPRLRP
ncbi:Plug domain-containing protein [Sphingomonas sp. I4]